MKRLFVPAASASLALRCIIFAIAVAILLPACNAFKYSAQLKFDVSDMIQTKATLNNHGETGPDITWEEGDLVTLKVEVNQGGDNGVPPKNYDTVDGKIVYENGAWVTYVARGSSFSKTEQITVTSPTLDCYVMMRYFLSNGDRETDPEHHFEVVWEEYRPFSEGRQSILVQLPSFMRHD